MVTITALPSRLISIGRSGENEHRRVAFDISEYLVQYPDATFGLIHSPAGVTAYPVATVSDGDETRALEVALGEFHTRVGAFLTANNRAMWAVTLTRADGRQIMQESRGAFPDMTPEPAEGENEV